jgi:hypothetical protein
MTRANAGRQWKRGHSRGEPTPGRTNKSAPALIKEIEFVLLREEELPKRRCSLCRAFLRSGNPTDRCAACSRKP